MEGNFLGGKAEIAIGATLIPAELIETIQVNFEEGVRESGSLAGKRRRPSGTFETAEVTGKIWLPSMDYLKVLWNDAYSEPAGTSQSTGHVIFGANSCQSKTPLPINIHYTCDTTDDNDIHIFGGLVKMDFSTEYNESDDLGVEFMIYAQPTEDGYVRFGTGDLTQPSKYDVATQKTVPVTEPES